MSTLRYPPYHPNYTKAANLFYRSRCKSHTITNHLSSLSIMTRSPWTLFLVILPLWSHIVGVYGAFSMVENNEGYVIWPNREVRYCFETPEAGDKYRADLKTAWNIWLGAGLSDSFKMTELDAETCNNAQHFLNTLLIFDSDTGRRPHGILATVPGFLGPKNHLRKRSQLTDPRMNRPLMALTSRQDIGMLNPIFNIAHELGHAWGLYHEHQNPNFWRGVKNAKSGKVFGMGNTVTYEGASIDNWQCPNLKDYSKIPEEISLIRNEVLRGLVTVDDVCKDQHLAKQVGFSGYDYLPFSEDIARGSTGHKAKDVDWDSIMLYNSKAGGSGTVTSNDDDQRLPILLQPSGALIPFNVFPSARDIEALETLYGLRKVKQSLLRKVGGSTTTNFNSLFSKSKGESSGSSCL